MTGTPHRLAIDLREGTYRLEWAVSPESDEPGEGLPPWQAQVLRLPWNLGEATPRGSGPSNVTRIDLGLSSRKVPVAMACSASVEPAS